MQQPEHILEVQGAPEASGDNFILTFDHSN